MIAAALAAFLATPAAAFAQVAADAPVSPAAAALAEPVMAASPTVIPPKREIIRDSVSKKTYLKLNSGVVAPIADAAAAQVTAGTAVKTETNVEQRYKVDAAIDSARIGEGQALRPSVKPVNLNHQLVKEPGKPVVYLVKKCNGKPVLYPIANMETLSTLRFSAQNIRQITPALRAQMAVGETVNAETMTVKYEDGAGVYRKVNGKLVPYTTEAEFRADAKDECDIIKLPPRVVPLPAPQPSPVPEPTPTPRTPGERPAAWGSPNQNFLDITLYTPPDYGYGYGLPGINQGFVALKKDQAVAYRAREATAWQVGEFKPTAAKDALVACQKYFPGTWMAQAMTNYNFLSAWYSASGIPAASTGWFLYACLQPPKITNLATPDAQIKYDSGAMPEPSDLGAVSYWYGKVNRHSVPNLTTLVGDVTWSSDPDGSSGANVDVLRYCQKWFPGTQSAQYIGGTTMDDWKDAGLRNSWKGGGATYACRSAAAVTPTFPTDTGSPTTLPTPVPTPVPNTTLSVPPLTAADHVRGSLDSAFKIATYTDFECPYCEAFHATLNEVRATYGTQLAVAYRNFPLTSIHPQAGRAAEAAECAAELGGNDGYWRYVDTLFPVSPISSSAAADPIAQLVSIAEQSGLDRTTFQSCLDSRRYAAKVSSDVSAAISAGAMGTPHSGIFGPNGANVIRGAVSSQELRQTIEGLRATAATVTPQTTAPTNVRVYPWD